MLKTPVSILQEMMVKKGSVPNYELIYDGGGTHENTFTYKVSAEGLSATGIGRCKKDAKHAAAKNMLDAIAAHNGFLPLPASPADSPVRTPLPKPMPTPHVLPPNEPFVNAIGVLQDICAENELGEVIYETISDVGPPHARVFTIQCVVSSFKEEGIATTKKQAKHEAARKMCNRIKELVDNAEVSILVGTSANKTKSMNPVSSIEIKEKINSLPFRRKANLGVKIADYHRKLSITFDETLRQEILQRSDKLKDLIVSTSAKVWIDSFTNEMLNKLKDILSPMNVDVQLSIQCPDSDELSDKFMVLLHLNTTPDILQIRIGNDLCELTRSVFLRVIGALELLLS